MASRLPFLEINSAGVSQLFKNLSRTAMYWLRMSINSSFRWPKQINVLVKLRLGRAGNHFNIMAQIFKRSAQVVDINTLSAAVGIAYAA